MSEADGALYEEPFRWAKEHVYPMRQGNRRDAYREYCGGMWSRGKACGEHSPVGHVILRRRK